MGAKGHDTIVLPEGNTRVQMERLSFFVFYSLTK